MEQAKNLLLLYVPVPQLAATAVRVSLPRGNARAPHCHGLTEVDAQGAASDVGCAGCSVQHRMCSVGYRMCRVQ